nr:hypothetical protein [Comamonas koreensis]
MQALVGIDRLFLLSHQPGALRVAEIASRLLGRPIIAGAPVPAAAPDPFIAQGHGEFSALMRAGHAAALTATARQVLVREAWTTELFWRRR